MRVLQQKWLKKRMNIAHSMLDEKPLKESVIPALRQAQDRLAYSQAGIQVSQVSDS
jgi:hypothetical protein